MYQWINFQQSLPQRLSLETLDREQTRAIDHLIMLYENKNLMVELLEHSLTSASELDSDN